METCILALLLVGAVNSKIPDTSSTPFNGSTTTTQIYETATHSSPTPSTTTQIYEISDHSSSTPDKWAGTGKVTTQVSSLYSSYASHSTIRSYRIVCKTVTIYGFLKRFCADLYRGGRWGEEETLDHIPDRLTNSRQLDEIHILLFKCAASSDYYLWENSYDPKSGGIIEEIRVSNMCPEDPGSYQVLLGIISPSFFYPPALSLSCALSLDTVPKPVITWLCQVDETSEVCDQKCSTYNCDDEAMCNGVSYGVFCYSTMRGNVVRYINPYEVCDYNVYQEPTDTNKLQTSNQNSLFRSRDWLSANQGPAFHDSVGSCVPRSAIAYAFHSGPRNPLPNKGTTSQFSDRYLSLTKYFQPYDIINNGTRRTEMFYTPYQCDVSIYPDLPGPDIPGTPIYREKPFPPSIPVNRGPTV
eukprot:sb/3465156/